MKEKKEFFSRFCGIFGGGTQISHRQDDPLVIPSMRMKGGVRIVSIPAD